MMDCIISQYDQCVLEFLNNSLGKVFSRTFPNCEILFFPTDEEKTGIIHNMKCNKTTFPLVFFEPDRIWNSNVFEGELSSRGKYGVVATGSIENKILMSLRYVLYFINYKSVDYFPMFKDCLIGNEYSVMASVQPYSKEIPVVLNWRGTNIIQEDIPYEFSPSGELSKFQFGFSLDGCVLYRKNLKDDKVNCIRDNLMDFSKLTPENQARLEAYYKALIDSQHAT